MLDDRGFNVEDNIAYSGATLDIPAFAKGKPQLAPSRVEATRRLANVRIRIECVIEAMR